MKYLFSDSPFELVTFLLPVKGAEQEIVKFGFSIKHFSEHSDLCLAGEDKNFIRKFMKICKGVAFK